MDRWKVGLPLVALLILVVLLGVNAYDYSRGDDEMTLEMIIERALRDELTDEEFDALDEKTQQIVIDTFINTPRPPSAEDLARWEEHFRTNLEHLTQGSSTASPGIDLQTIERFVFSIGDFWGGEGIAIDKLHGRVHFDIDGGSYGRGVWWLDTVAYSADFIDEDLTRLIDAIERSHIFEWPDFIRGEIDEDKLGGDVGWALGIQFSDGSRLVKGGNGHRGQFPERGFGAILGFMDTMGSEIQERHRLEVEAAY